MYRKDGSYFDDSQLRNNGKFVKQRVSLTLPDRLFLEQNGFTAEQARKAVRVLNIEIDNRIRAGESEKEILRQMKLVFDTKQNCFVDS
jgi:hypothetical protein